MQNLAIMARWLTIMNEKSQAREAEEFLCVAEIVLGRPLEGRDTLASMAEKARRSPAQAGQTAAEFSMMSGGILKLTGRAIDIAQDAYRNAVAQMKRLTGREDADTEADALEAAENKVLVEDAGRKAPEEKVAAVAAARREDAQQMAEGKKAMDEAEREVTEPQTRAAALEVAKRETAEDARLDAEEIPVPRQRKRRAKLLTGQGRIRKSKAERAGADLAQERTRTRKLKRQVMARGHEQKRLAQRHVRTPVLEQQLSIRQIDQKLLTPEVPGNLEAARLMEQARLLLDEGNIIAARSVLERAVESGNALALFLLAETYDPASLSAWGMFSTWGIFGRRGDVTKAQELYAQASALGVHEAKYRLSALRQRRANGREGSPP
jgi:TPR repeat protein